VGVWVLVVRRGTNDIAEAEVVAVLDQFVEMRTEVAHAVVGADATQAGLVHGVAKLFGGAVIVAGGFNFGVAESGELVKGAFKVLGKQFANAVELEADGQSKGRGGEVTRADTGDGCCRG
jgi:hypothetical protein